MPLLTFDTPGPPKNTHARRTSASRTQQSGAWKTFRRIKYLVQTYAPAVVAVILILSPLPSIIVVTIAHHYKIDSSIKTFVAHIALACLLTFLALSSFIVCIARDPGPVSALKGREEDVEREALPPPPQSRREDEMSLAEALAGPSIGDAESSDEDSEIGVDDQGERRWCRKCWAPKPERAHHCSYCKRCVLKMDHHCPWLANNCVVGHRTYPSFIHFLVCTALIAVHATMVSISPLKWYFNNSVDVADLTPLHALYLALGGAIFTLSMGSFVGFHAYLVTTGQTTLEQLSPYMLLRYLPPSRSGDTDPNAASDRSFESDIDLHSMLNSGPEESEIDTGSSLLPSSHLPSLPLYPPPGHSVPVSSRDNASQLAEHTMTRNQRRLVRNAAGKIQMYDLGWRQNWLDLFSVRHERFLLDWLEIIWWGGRGTRGDGKTFLRNPKAAGMLVRLRERLDDA
ncbi:zf-DHHC-domain-containing protein [Ceratobasidium sp. AG-I]|nr:zf-DHHC-domain-containing protein [Ceratobasidium sp. AG-I]